MTRWFWVVLDAYIWYMNISALFTFAPNHAIWAIIISANVVVWPSIIWKDYRRAVNHEDR